MQNRHETMSTILATNMPECTTHWLWLQGQNAEWTWNHKHHSRMHSSPPINVRAECRMDMEPWVPLQLPTCQNAQLTNYKCQSRTQNWHKTISTIPVTNMAACTTHLLWVPEKDAEWTWNHEQHSSHQQARMHNSPSMSARAGCRMDMKP